MSQKTNQRQPHERPQPARPIATALYALHHTAFRRRTTLPLITLLLSLTLPACLSNSYEIPHEDLTHLMSVAPQDRGQAVYAVQRMGTATEPPRAPSWAPQPGDAPADGTPTTVVYDSRPYGYYGPSGYWYVMPPIYMGFGQPTYYARSAAVGGPVSTMSGSGGVMGSGLSGASYASRGDSKSAAAALVAALVGAALVATIGFAATEGARYDGIVAVHPHHPVHLMSPGGGERLIGLDDLRLEDLRENDTAVIVADEGAGMWKRRRRPLHHEGFAWQFGAGWMMQQVAADRALSGFVVHTNLGYFVGESLGIVAAVDTGAASDYATPGDMWFLRYGAELVWLPVHVGLWHFGPRVGGGWQYINTGGGDWAYLADTQPFVTAGVESEIEMTTRLAFSIRAGGLWQPTAPWSGAVTPSVQLGLNIY